MNEPVRFVEAPWTADRRRLVKRVPWSRLSWYQAGGLISAPIVVSALHYGLGYLMWLFPVGAVGGLVYRRHRLGLDYIRSQYRPPSATNPDEVGLVRLVLLFNQYEYAEDIGFLSVHPSSVTFEGAQTTFSLSPARMRLAITRIDLIDRPGYAVKFLTLSHLGAGDDLMLPSGQDIGSALVRTVAIPNQRPVVVALPPLRPVRVDVVSRRRQFRTLEIAIGIFFALSLAPLAYFMFHANWMNVVGIPALLVLIVLSKIHPHLRQRLAFEIGLPLEGEP